MKRVAWLDTAKAYGIFLVFYGHVMQQIVASPGSLAATSQLKLIYSFHMPLFFVLSGYLARDKKCDYRSFVKRTFLSRMIPVYFFGLLTLPFWTVWVISGQLEAKDLLKNILYYIKGKPILNYVTWFLVCLFVVENLNFWIMPRLKSRRQTFFTILGFYCLGSIIIWKAWLVWDVTGIELNFWFIHEAIIAYAFYLSGHLLKAYAANFSPVASKKTAFVWGLISLPVLIATFDLNRGPFLFNPHAQVVLMGASQHGNLFLFPVTALAGIVFILSIAYLTPDNRITHFIGSNTLPLMGLDGLFVCFLNERILQMLGVPSEPFRLLGMCLLIASMSILVCIPFVLLLNRYLSQLIGRPETLGPILPNLLIPDYKQVISRIYASIRREKSAG